MARASTAPFEAIPGSLGGLGPAMVETLALALSPCPYALTQNIFWVESRQRHTVRNLRCEISCPNGEKKVVSAAMPYEVLAPKDISGPVELPPCGPGMYRLRWMMTLETGPSRFFSPKTDGGRAATPEAIVALLTSGHSFDLHRVIDRVSDRLLRRRWFRQMVVKA